MSKRFPASVISFVSIVAAAGFVSSPRLSGQAPQSTQGDRFVARLLQNRYALSVRGGELSGAGAPVLQSAIAQARFVLLGEYHGVSQTPELGAAVCRAAAPEGLHTMAVEVGPLVAAELDGWVRRPDGVAQLSAFERKFPESINIYNTREEFAMLQQCARSGGNQFRLWGLNQEMYGAAGLILSRVLESGVGKEARPAMQQLLQKSDDASRKALQSGNVFDLFMPARLSKASRRVRLCLQRSSHRLKNPPRHSRAAILPNYPVTQSPDHVFTTTTYVRLPPL